MKIMKTIELAIKGTPHQHQLLIIVGSHDHINPNPPPKCWWKKKGRKKKFRNNERNGQ